MIDRDKLNEYQLALLDAALIENGENVASKIYEYLTTPTTRVCVVKNSDTGKDKWAIVVVDDNIEDFWIDAYDTSEKAIEMVEKLGLKFTWMVETLGLKFNWIE